jgi:hypothetical protein
MPRARMRASMQHVWPPRKGYPESFEKISCQMRGICLHDDVRGVWPARPASCSAESRRQVLFTFSARTEPVACSDGEWAVSEAFWVFLSCCVALYCLGLVTRSWRVKADICYGREFAQSLYA